MHSKIVRFVLIVAVATVLGPLVGGLGLLAASIATDIARGEFVVGDLAAMFRLFLLGAYVVGGVIALVAGILLASLSLWRSPTLPMILAAAAAANLICFLMMQVGVSYGSAGFAANLAASLFAGTVCWFIFRTRLRT